MAYFRSIFFYWWMLLVALYAVKQPVGFNDPDASATLSDVSSVRPADTFISHEYLIPGFIFTSGYDIKLPIPDLDIPYWARITKSVKKLTGFDSSFTSIIWIIISLTIIFPFHDFW